MVSLSFEFFPPKDGAGQDTLGSTAAALAALNPAFVTVTYGAGGSTREGTAEAIDLVRVSTENKIPVGAHLTFYGANKNDILTYADRLWDKGVRHLVALRGDAPKGSSPVTPNDPDKFHKTPDFVAALKTRHDFTIFVGAYPEKHPDAPDFASDLRHLKQKVDAGASAAITQLFFENETFFRFRDAAAKAGITCPIHPGLLPIHDFAKAQSFAAKCGADIPAWLADQFQNTPTPNHPTLAANILKEQIEGLKSGGVSHFHLYTLNRADLVLAALGSNPVH